MDFFLKAGDNIVGLPSSLFRRLFWESKAGCAGRDCGLEAVLYEVGLRSLGGRRLAYKAERRSPRKERLWGNEG